MEPGSATASRAGLVLRQLFSDEIDARASCKAIVQSLRPRVVLVPGRDGRLILDRRRMDASSSITRRLTPRGFTSCRRVWKSSVY
jgi:hypothetical protein